MTTPADPSVQIQGRAISYEPVLSPAEYARLGRARRADALQALTAGRRREAETLAREAIEHLVDAFLFDRKGHRACFAEAHELGRVVARILGCPMKLSKDGESWASNCGVSALHARFGTSHAGTSLSLCSICGAGDLECDHIRGTFYDGQRCHRVIYEMTLPEISLVRFPDDPRCYRLEIPHSREKVEAAFGGPLPANVTPVCTHCIDCDAAENGAQDDDIDQSLWPELER